MSTSWNTTKYAGARDNESIGKRVQSRVKNAENYKLVLYFCFLGSPSPKPRITLSFPLYRGTSKFTYDYLLTLRCSRSGHIVAGAPGYLSESVRYHVHQFPLEDYKTCSSTCCVSKRLEIFHDRCLRIGCRDEAMVDECHLCVSNAQLACKPFVYRSCQTSPTLSSYTTAPESIVLAGR